LESKKINNNNGEGKKEVPRSNMKGDIRKINTEEETTKRREKAGSSARGDLKKKERPLMFSC